MAKHSPQRCTEPADFTMQAGGLYEVIFGGEVFKAVYTGVAVRGQGGLYLGFVKDQSKPNACDMLFAPAIASVRELRPGVYLGTIKDTAWPENDPPVKE